MVIIMIKKLTLIWFLTVCLFFALNIKAFAQFDIEKTDIEKVIDINNRITSDYIKDFAETRNLKFNELAEIDKINSKLAKKTFNDYTYAEQKAIGKSLLEKFLASHKLYTADPLLVKYVATVGKLVSSHMDDQEGSLYIYGITDDTEIKIYVLPGGYIFITRGFLKALENEAQLAAALAREISSLNRYYLLDTLMQNQEALTLLSSLKTVLNRQKKGGNNEICEEEVKLAKKPFSDPFDTLDYFASPSFENLYSNEDYLSKKMLKKMSLIIPSYETIIKKDKQAMKAIEKAGYDPESIKDMIITLNKQQKQVQTLNRSINIENWLGEKTLRKRKKNTVEGRFLMMIERLNY
jgi:hypothetical protein